jgi:hypothetical protein
MADTNKLAEMLQRFFKQRKASEGRYRLYSRAMVQQHSRQRAKKFNKPAIGQVSRLLYSGIHEERLVALLILSGDGAAYQGSVRNGRRIV